MRAEPQEQRSRRPPSSHVELNDSKSKAKSDAKLLSGCGLAARRACRVNLFSFAACAALLPAWRRNTKEAGRCVTLSLELFKEHAAPRLHANAVVTLVFLFAAAALTFCAC